QGLDNINVQDEQENPHNHPNFIPISSSDKLRLYSPWKYSLIVKLIGKRIGYIYFQNRLQALWQLSEKISLIDVSEDFYFTKLAKPENYDKILHQGPWFLG
ncbi:hypothetical protein MTR67_007284, partial [Solanum verrucosum]